MVYLDNKNSAPARRMISSVLAGLCLRTTVFDYEDDREIDQVAGSWPEYKTLISRFRAYEDCVLGLTSGTIKHVQMRELLNVDLQSGVDPASISLLVPKKYAKVAWNAAQYGHLCSALCLYWLVDVLAHLADVGHRLPSRCGELDFQASERLSYYSELSDWPLFMSRFKDVLERNVSTERCPWTQTGSACWRLLLFLDSNSYQSARNHVMANLTVAAMHLAFLKEYVTPIGLLPDLPDQINENVMKDAPPDVRMFLVELARVASFFVTSRSQTAKGGQSLASFRAPLQLALAISPLYLFCPTVLCKKTWNRRAMLGTAFHLKKCRPFVLTETEKCVWTVILAMANGTLDPFQALKKLEEELPWSLIASVELEGDRLWFKLPVFEPQVQTQASSSSFADARSHASVVNLDAGDFASFDVVPGRLNFGEPDSNISNSAEDRRAPVVSENINRARVADVEALEGISTFSGADSIASSSESGAESDREEEAIFSCSVDTEGDNAALEYTTDEENMDEVEGEAEYCASQSSDGTPKSLFVRRSSRVRRPVGVTIEDEVVSFDEPALFFPDRSDDTSAAPFSISPTSDVADGNVPMEAVLTPALYSRLLSDGAVREDEPDIMSIKDCAEDKEQEMTKESDHLLEGSRVRSKKSFVLFNSKGKSFCARPESHLGKTVDDLEFVFTTVEASYRDGKPMHVYDADQSVVAAITYDDFLCLSDVELCSVLKKKNVVVSGAPQDTFSLEERGLSAFYPLQNPILVRDHSRVGDIGSKGPGGPCIPASSHAGVIRSLPLDAKVGPPTRIATLMDVIRESANPQGRILEVPHIPLPLQEPCSALHSGNVQAWYHTQGRQRSSFSDVFPSSDVRWASVAVEHAVTFFRLSPQGMHSYSSVRSGQHVWIFMRPSSLLRSCATNSQELEEDSCSTSTDLECIVLEAGDFLFLRADQMFATYALQSSVVRGEYFYSALLMRISARGIYRSFSANRALVGQFAVGSLELRRRLMDFVRMGFIENSLSSSAGAALTSLPDIQSMSGVQELLSLCCLHILANVLDPRTYASSTFGPSMELNSVGIVFSRSHAPAFRTISIYERLAMIHARGVALELFDWIRFSCCITPSEGETLDDFPTEHLLAHMWTLLKYKAEYQEFADSAFLVCDYAAVHRQVMNVLTCDDRFSRRWSVPKNFNTFDIPDEPSYTVVWSQGPIKPLRYAELLRRGATSLDLEYLESRGIHLREDITVSGMALDPCHKDLDDRRCRKRARVEEEGKEIVD